MVELVRYVSEEFRRGDSIPLTLLWLFALAASRATRDVEVERWREATRVGPPSRAHTMAALKAPT